MLKQRNLWTALVLGSVLLVDISGTAAGQATPDVGTPIPAATIQKLFEVMLPGEWRPEGDAQVLWSRETWGVGARISRPAIIGASAVTLFYVLAGTMLLRSDGPLLLSQAEGSQIELSPPGIPGEAIMLSTGTIAIFQSGAAFHARNPGQIDARILSTQIGTVPPDGTSAIGDVRGVEYQELGVVEGESWASVPEGSLLMRVQRTLVPLGGVVGPYFVSETAPELLAIEAGTMEIGYDDDGDGQADRWTTVIPGSVGVDSHYVDDNTTRVLRASSEVATYLGGESNTPGPLVYLSLTFTPTNI